MELRLLQTFAAVAELRHFARAADRCHLSQPAVSHQIRLLEEELGTRLLNRDRRRVSLTVAGELLLEDARRILAAVERARERAQNVSRGSIGRVRVGATETAGLHHLPPVLEGYRQAHPAFAVEFTIGAEIEVLERVAANELDMAVVAGKPVLGELQARRIGGEQFLLVASPAAPVAKRKRLQPADLRDERWILREDGSDTRRQQDVWLRRHRLNPQRPLRLHGPDAVKRAVRAGLGVALLPRTVVSEDVADGRLRTLPVTAALPVRDLLLVDHPHKHHGAACRALIDLLTGKP